MSHGAVVDWIAPHTNTYHMPSTRIIDAHQINNNTLTLTATHPHTKSHRSFHTHAGLVCRCLRWHIWSALVHSAVVGIGHIGRFLAVGRNRCTRAPDEHHSDHDEGDGDAPVIGVKEKIMRKWCGKILVVRKLLWLCKLSADVRGRNTKQQTPKKKKKT